MAKYVVPPELDAMLRKMQLDIKSLQQKVANLGPVPVGSGGSVFDSNVIWNGSMESGTTGFRNGFTVGGSIGFGTIHTETADPLFGLISLREDELASSASRVYWVPGSTSSPITGSDVFATVPGDQWQLKCSLRSSVSVPDAKLYASTGTTAADVYGLPGASTTWTAAANLPLVAGVKTALSGLITVPASRSFIGLHVVGAETPPGAAWSWTLDEVVLQRKLT